MPDKPKTPHRTVRVAPELWEAAKRKAAERGETVTDVIRRTLEDYTQAPISPSHDEGCEAEYIAEATAWTECRCRLRRS